MPKRPPSYLHFLNLFLLFSLIRFAYTCSEVGNHDDESTGFCSLDFQFKSSFLPQVGDNSSHSHTYGADTCGRDSILDYGSFEHHPIEQQPPALEPETPPRTPLYEVRTSPGKGLGMFATSFLPAGTKIITESPLVSVPIPEMVPGQGFRLADMIPSLEASFALLSHDEQALFLSLHDFRFPSEIATGQSHLLTIFRSNAYNTGEDHIGLFPKVARINHSCRPNCGNHWSEKRGERAIYAARDIEEGEEITVSYIPLLKKTAERQARLGQYGFRCDCAACRHPTTEGDKRRAKIGRAIESLEQKLSYTSKKNATNDKHIARAMSLIEMLEQEELTDYMAEAFNFAAIFNKRRGNVGKALEWATKELEILRWAEGDSNEVFKALEFIESLKEKASQGSTSGGFVWPSWTIELHKSVG